MKPRALRPAPARRTHPRCAALLALVVAAAFPTPVEGSETVRLVKRSVRRALGDEAPRRVEAAALRLDDLPVAAPPPALEPESRPARLPIGDKPAELAFEPIAPGDEKRLRSGRGFATVHARARVALPHRFAVGGDATSHDLHAGVTLTCALEAPPALLPLRWESLAPGEGGSSARYDVADGWFDPRACAAVFVRRTAVEARAILGGLAFAFRDGARLTVLVPGPARVEAAAQGGEVVVAEGGLTRVSLPLVRGGSASATAHLVRPSPLGTPKGVRPQVPELLGFEIVQAVREREPTLLVYSVRRAGR